MTTRWGMVIDVNRCVGCQSCTIACKHANDTTPGVQWRQVLDVETGRFPDVGRLFLVVGCQHCAEPPCVPVCPTGATRQRADGLVTMDYDTCIGCGYCAVACPYQARTIVHDESWYYGEETVQEHAVAHDERLGVAQKCTFCVDRVDEATELGLTPGIDLETTPACAASCIAQAIHFGDFANPESNVSRLVAENSSFQMHAELGTDPQIKYLYETPAVPGRDPLADDADDEALADAANPLAGPRQTLWDERAAMNFTLGGFGSGLAVMAYLAGMQGPALAYSYLAAGAIMAVGLFFVLLEIGRKRRSLYVLLRPQTSWMTREAYAAALFYPVVLSLLIWPHPVLQAVAAGAALAFLYCQGRILHAGKGIPAWRVPAMPWMLVATGFLEGVALLGLAAGWLPSLPAEFVAGAGMGLALLNAALWGLYQSEAKGQGIGPLARSVLARVNPWVQLVGRVGPAALYAGAFMWPADSVALFAVAGVGVLAGGALWKFAIITRACHQQGFALAKMPQRGSGTRAAPVLPSAIAEAAQ